ncbi:MAG: SDR family NAD(P)-dependent oxidoreductase [Chloroflexi bacterium]|nr:SDR family NAD(P)-dependent oxidoreductase [Chloroflexota bacterium]
MDPKGKVAVISGGASGIGLATAKLLASNGASVVIADLQTAAGADAVAEIEAAHGKAHFVETDVLEKEDLQRVLDEAVKRFGRVDIAYNNAGVGEGGDFLEPGNETWERCFNIDLTAVIQAVQLEVQLMRSQGGGGVIISTASMGGLLPMPTSPIYATAKAGVIHLSRSLGYLAAEGIRVNAICPTFTNTPLVQAAGEAAMEAMKQEVGGILQPEDVAAGVLELIADDSRAGSVMRVTVRKGLDYAHEPRR